MPRLINGNNRDFLIDVLASKGTFNLNRSIGFWESFLLNRVMRLIKVETDAFPPSEWKKKLILSGMACIRRSQIYNNIGVYWCSFADTTGQYYDFPRMVNYNSGTGEAGEAYPDSDCIVVRNSSLCLPLYPLITRYAVLLAHTDLTIINILVNMRAGKAIPIAKTDSVAKSIDKFYNKIFNGSQAVIMDEEMMGVDLMHIADTETGRTLLDAIEARNNIITMFFNDIGVQSAKSKKGNMLTPEILSEAPRLLISLNEMLDYWKEGADDCKDMFGIDIKIELSEEIENQFSIVSTSKQEGSEVNENT